MGSGVWAVNMDFPAAGDDGESRVENSEHVRVTWVGLCLRADVEIVAMGDDEL